ncbi:MBL fold metallo-hydrolase [Neobacillus cucumis]|uniref:MBL fold metallo-hydrolase n=1 Tax=Neobacillus cucumis TaxID=1740721 RepID=UPI0019635852|nr:MBL fold metallo-hydrolase [Neobacillus cucumis]MBM7650853.1 glyoxylase-like metal-dependent hydrolase (beta-lactamase superfamily II) [Neobacillus cucumis]MED4227274.1 MBL fold metallo-hydrolase [Neobacillus cucumis]
MRVIKKGFLYQVTFMAKVFPVNCYLVEEADGLTLIDAALGFCAKGILQAARTIGKPITKIILTHAHEDHVGALDMLKEALPEVPVYISSRDYRLMNNDRSLDPHEDQTPIKGGVPKSLKTRANILLKEGELVGSLTAIETPGHTPGSMSFLDLRTKALIAGDAFQTRGGIAVAGDLKPWFPFPAFGTWSKKTALASAGKMISYQPKLLAVGHGEMVEEPMFMMEKAIDAFNRKME